MKKGFTLIELLIVIGILAVLAGIVVVALNPAELLRQARDSKRVADLRGITGALNLFLVDVSSSTLTCVPPGGYATASSTGSNPFATSIGTTTVGVVANQQKVNATGWIPTNFNWVSGGSPIATLPVDPTNSDVYNYNYLCTTTGNTVFKLAARLESVKLGGQMTTDGGISNTWYETGNSLTL